MYLQFSARRFDIMTFGTMDLCLFVKVLVGGLALRILVTSKPIREGIHSLIFPFFCEIKFEIINLVDDYIHLNGKQHNSFIMTIPTNQQSQ